jgi:hypothetical protein
MAEAQNAERKSLAVQIKEDRPMTRTASNIVFKYPPGIEEGARVIANKRHAIAYRNTRPKRRQGTVTAPTSILNFCYILWDGTTTDRPVHRNHFDLVRKMP